MLFQHKKSLLIALTSLVVSGTSIGGAVNAEPLAAETQEFRYPPAETFTPPQTMAAPVRQPNVVAQPRMAPRYPMPYPAPAQRPMNPGMAPYGAPQYGAPAPYGAPMNYPPVNRPPVGGPPMAGPVPMGPPGSSPYGNPYNRGPYNAGPYNAGPYNTGPNNSGPFGGGPFNNGPFGGGSPLGGGNNPFDKFGFGPFNRNTAPWETWPFGSKDSFWSRKEIPFDDQNPTDWFNPGDPKEGLAIMWEDLISAPDDLGTMPGGWNVPSISVPNPVDLEDQMEKASKEVPDLIRIYH